MSSNSRPMAVTEMSIIKRMVLLLLLVSGIRDAGAQAFDGNFDFKLYAGYMTVDFDPGFEIGADYGCNDWLSLGTGVRYRIADKSKFDEPPQGMDGFDVKAHAYIHGQHLLGLPSWLDVYAGPFVGFHTGGMCGGVRMNFSEWIGVYADCAHPLFNTFKNKSNDDLGLYRGHTVISVGLTVNLE